MKPIIALLLCFSATNAYSQVSIEELGLLCPVSTKISEHFEHKNQTYFSCSNGLKFKAKVKIKHGYIKNVYQESLTNQQWNNIISDRAKDTMDPFIKLCSFSTDKLIIYCPQGPYVRTDMMEDEKVAPFLAIEIQMQNLDSYKEKKLKKLPPLDVRLEHCTYYTDKLLIDCPDASYVRVDKVKDEKIVQFIKDKKAYDQRQLDNLKPDGTSKD